VAAEAGVAVGTVFLHYPTMAQLAEVILDQTVGAALEAAAGSRPDGTIERLVHVAGALYDGYDHDPELARQVIGGSLFESAEGSPSQVRMAQFREWVCAEVARGIDRGEIEPIEPGHAFLTFFAFYFGALVGGLRGELGRPAQLTLLRTSLQRMFGVKEVH
jgi:AcrR family transcriptional regulator